MEFVEVYRCDLERMYDVLEKVSKFYWIRDEFRAEILAEMDRLKIILDNDSQVP